MTGAYPPDPRAGQPPTGPQPPWPPVQPGPPGGPGPEPPLNYPPYAPNQPYPPAQPYPSPPGSAPYPPPGSAPYPPPGSAPYPPVGEYPTQQYPPYPALGYPQEQFAALREGQPEPPKKGIGKRTVGGLVALLVVLVGVAVRAGGSNLFSGHDSGANPSSSAAIDAVPVGIFDGTPASTYPAGAEGIVLPPATAVSGFTKAQVSAALAKVKQALVASRLDSAMLVSHQSSTFVNLFAADDRASVTKDFSTHKFFAFASQLAPGNTLTSDPIRVKGAMSFSASTSDGVRELDVVTNFVWVYPFAGTRKEAGDHLVVVRDKVTWGFPADNDVDKSSRGMWLLDASAFGSNIDCDQLANDLLALGTPTFVVGGGQQDDNAPFDPNASIDSLKETC